MWVLEPPIIFVWMVRPHVFPNLDHGWFLNNLKPQSLSCAAVKLYMEVLSIYFRIFQPAIRDLSCKARDLITGFPWFPSSAKLHFWLPAAGVTLLLFPLLETPACWIATRGPGGCTKARSCCSSYSLISSNQYYLHMLNY